MKLFPIGIILVLSGCVSVPIPPIGNNVGDYGNLQISLAIKYFPKENNLDWFNPIIPQPKLYNDK